MNKGLGGAVDPKTPIVCLETIYELTEQVPLTVEQRAHIEACRNVALAALEDANKLLAKKPAKRKKPRKR